MQIIELPLFDIKEESAPVLAGAHVANLPTFLGKVYPAQHADLGYLVPNTSEQIEQLAATPIPAWREPDREPWDGTNYLVPVDPASEVDCAGCQ